MNIDGLRPWAGLGVDATAGASARIVVAGIPYDGSAVYRKGAAQGPAQIRRLSAVMPPVSEAGSVLDFGVHDLGDLDLGAGVEMGWRAVADTLAAVPRDQFLTVLGGDHCVEIPVLAAQARRHPGLAIAWIDAHPDLCDFSRGGGWTCGCALKRALEVSGVEPSAVAMAGCRDFDPEEIDWIQRNGTLMLTAASVSRDPQAAGAALARAAAGRPLHVSIDIDVLDPAFAPGTEIASPGGLSTRELLSLLQELGSGATLVGLDLVEVSPPLDHAEVTSLAALKIAFEVWGMVWKKPR